jgi:hypothetical protein
MWQCKLGRAKSNDKLQIAVNELNEIIKRYDMKYSFPKQKQWDSVEKNMKRVKLKFKLEMLCQNYTAVNCDSKKFFSETETSFTEL